MKINAFNTVLGAIATVGVLTAIGQQAQAGTIHNGWNYSIDSTRDGTGSGKIGEKSDFEFYGIAFKQVKDKVYFAINSNLSLDGSLDAKARNGKISYGDLFLDFGKTGNFNQANGNLHGVRFDAGNDTRLEREVTVMEPVQVTKKVQVQEGTQKVKVGTERRLVNGRWKNVDIYETRPKMVWKNVTTTEMRPKVVTEAYDPGLGLYGGVSTTSVATVNSGYNSHSHHATTVAKMKDSVNPNLAGFASLGDMAANNSYFAYDGAIQNVMKTGERLGGIQMISDMKNVAGLDFGNFGTKGKHTFGFSIDASLLPKGDFVASLFAECGNDGMVLNGRINKIPEPTMLLGLSAVGLLAGRQTRRRRLANNG
jgi:hypothetical protein